MTSAENTAIELGIAAQRAGNWRVALQQYDTAILADPKDAIAYQLRGGLRLELGRLHDALADYDQSIQLAPYSEIGYMGKGHVFVALKDYRWAVIQFTNALDQLPDDASELAALYLDRANAYAMLGEHAMAAADRELAAGISP